MVTNSTQPRPFDEQAALAELERLAERIQSSRKQREQAVAEFDAFVKTFKDDQFATRLKAVDALPPPLPPARDVRAADVDPPAPTPASATPAPAIPLPESVSARTDRSSTPTAEDIPSTAVSEARVDDTARVARSITRTHSSPAALLNAPAARLGLAAAGVLFVVLLIMWFNGGSAEPPPSAAAPAAAPGAAPGSSPAQAPPAASEPKPVASTGPVRPINVELVTIRPVWARVTVDDRKVIERELPTGQRIPLAADRSIVIRAGDAGAMRVIVDGKDQGPVGRDGFPATRTIK